MAMIKCPECGKDISNQSDKCTILHPDKLTLILLDLLIR